MGGGGTYPPALPKSHKGTMWEGGWSVNGCDDFPSHCWLKDGLSFSFIAENSNHQVANGLRTIRLLTQLK